jgi:DMSO/TMAO reductase YedYZ molybdopterin-dependent catalytic subunit
MLYKSYFLSAVCIIFGFSIVSALADPLHAAIPGKLHAAIPGKLHAAIPDTPHTGIRDTLPATIRVEGEVSHPLTLSAADLAGMRRVDFRAKDHDQSEHVFSGVPLSEILQLAGVPMGPQLRGKNMAKYLLVRAADGYQVVFALPELDSAFAQRVIFLADEEDGRPLPAGKGPFRLVVPGEKKPARWIWEVNSLLVRSAKE